MPRGASQAFEDLSLHLGWDWEHVLCESARRTLYARIDERLEVDLDCFDVR